MIRKTTGGVPALVGADSLGRWQEFISIPGYGLGSYNIAWTGLAFGHHMTGSLNAGNAAAVWRSLGSVNAFVRPIAGLGLVLEFLPAAAAAGAREVFYQFTPFVATALPLEFIPTWPAAVEPTPAVPPSLACSISAWIRKRNAGDLPGARQFPIGFANVQDINFSRRIARVGLYGDGAGGFRFGSNNCPTAPAGGNENNQGDADANSVRPNALIAPGTNWFHARIKMVSSSSSQSGRFLCYLNQRLVATFATNANFPQSSRSAIDVAEIDYWAIMPSLGCWGNPDGVTVDPGFYMRDLRVRLEEDQSA